MDAIKTGRRVRETSACAGRAAVGPCARAAPGRSVAVGSSS